LGPVRAANLALKFALEVVAVAAFAYWGGNTASGAVAVVLAIAAPLVAIVVWGRWAAPRSEQRLALLARLPLELTVFALAALALLRFSTAAAVTFAAVVVGNAMLLSLFDQWEA
jgi:hypothetical protein